MARAIKWNREEVRALVLKHGGVRAAATAIGAPRSSLWSAINPRIKGTQSPAAAPKPDRALQAAEQRIAVLEGALRTQAKHRNPVSLELEAESNTLRFGVIGDTHWGSLYEADAETTALYEYFHQLGVKDVLHAGDVLDGHGMYKGQEFELHSHGWALQRDWFVQHAPLIPGMTTHFVTGNHDASFKKTAGIDVGPELQDRRPDWNFLGEDRATIVFTAANGRKYKVMVMHPGGGSSYAISYRPQKVAEQIEGGIKPNMLLIGNYHKANWLPAYRNISVVQVGCLQWQSPFMLTKGLAAHVGGWLVEVCMQDPDELLSNSVTAKFVSFYNRGTP